MTERHQVTIRELAEHASELLARVACGQEIAVISDRHPIAVITSEPIESKMRELVEMGVLPANWREERGKFAQWLRDNPPLPGDPSEKSLSETLIEMRNEERF